MIQTVKCSPLVDIKFNPGFYDALCTLNFFFFRGTIPSILLSSEASRIVTKNKFLRFYLRKIDDSSSEMLSTCRYKV